MEKQKNEIIYIDQHGNMTNVTPPPYGELTLKFQDGLLISTETRTKNKII